MLRNEKKKYFLRVFISFCLLTTFALQTLAHDYWFEADKFFLSENAPVTLHLQLGTRLVIEEERPYQIKKTVFFKLFSSHNVLDLLNLSADGATPVAKFNVGKAGTYLIAMERNPSDIVLDSKKFNEYLKEENLTEVIKQRAARGENGKFGYERYSRFIKTLIQVGDKKDKTYQKILGFKLEIIPLENPYNKKTGGSIKFKILFNGQPLKQKSVFAYNRSDAQIFIQQMQTDDRGICKLKIERNGFWLVRLVNMERCQKNCEETDWESYWGALSFEIR